MVHLMSRDSTRMGRGLDAMCLLGRRRGERVTEMKRAIAIKVGCLSLLVIFIRLSGLFPVLEFGPVTAEGAGPFEGEVVPANRTGC